MDIKEYQNIIQVAYDYASVCKDWEECCSLAKAFLGTYGYLEVHTRYGNLLRMYHAETNSVFEMAGMRTVDEDTWMININLDFNSGCAYYELSATVLNALVPPTHTGVVHISELKNSEKTANNLSKLTFVEDKYHREIKQAAKQKVYEGKGHLKYGGHYASGNVWWQGE